MDIVNRRGEYNEVMFKELAEYAMHQKKYDNFHYECILQVNNVNKMKLEDIRCVFTKPKKIQLKARVAELFINAGLMTFKKTDTVKIIVKPVAPSKEPITTITVTEWFDELESVVPGIEKNANIKVMPNKWLYLRGTES